MVRVGDRAPNAHAARGEAAMQSQQRIFAHETAPPPRDTISRDVVRRAIRIRRHRARDAGTAAMISSSAASNLEMAMSTSSSSATYRVASIAVASNSTSLSRNRR